MDFFDPKETDYYQKSFLAIKASNLTVKNKRFEDCKFDQLNLTDFETDNCQFINCTFKNSVLTPIKLTDSEFIDVSFKNCKMIGVDWTKAKTLRSLIFNTCKLNYSNFSLLKLSKTHIIDCEAKECVFTETDLSESKLNSTDFSGSNFLKTNLTKADFRGAKNYLIDINTNIIKHAKFSFPEVINLLKNLDIDVEY